MDRWSALEKLKEDGSDDALFGLCRRFGITSMKGVEDEAEKNWWSTPWSGSASPPWPP